MSTIEHYGTLFPAAVVGSLPRPDRPPDYFFLAESYDSDWPVSLARATTLPVPLVVVLLSLRPLVVLHRPSSPFSC